MIEDPRAQEQINKISDDQLNQDLNEIEPILFGAYNELIDGLPDGSNPEWGYDDLLVHDIALAVHRWRVRCNIAANPLD